jgi:tyrosyl-tRNA synthetase
VTSAEDQLRILERGAVELLPREELLAKLRLGRPLVIKAGFDPSAPDIHLGHTVVMRKMKAFQDLGHDCVFVVGDFTARIGDPSGRTKTRPPLSTAEIEKNAATYRAQATRLLDPGRTRFEFNSTWLDALGADGWLRLAGRMTVARMLERDDFAKRFRSGQPISIHEFLYPLAQGYDSVALRADVELGGTDQTFNLLVGRDLMREHGLEPQCILTTRLLVGLDGHEKMSKSLGNYIGIDEEPREIFGKVMSASDALMWDWYGLLTPLTDGEIAEVRTALHPMRAKQDLARRIVTEFHGAEAADQAERHFTAVFRERASDAPSEELSLTAEDSPVPLPRLLVLGGLAPSTSEARRLLRDGAVHVDGERVTDAQRTLSASAGSHYEIKVGKHRFARLRFG